MEVIEYGLKKKWKAVWYERPRKDDACFQITPAPLKRTYLTLTHMASSFVLLGMGYFISILVFIGEIVIFRYSASPFNVVTDSTLA